MKNISTFILSIFLFSHSLSLVAQDGGGEYPFVHNDENHPCLSPEQYQEIEKTYNESIKNLRLEQVQNTTGAVTFSWPLRTANGLNDCSYYIIGAYVDQNPGSNAIKDYNCGSTTYDAHKGTDIGLYPFPFYKMDNNQVEVIAAAPGTIVTKVDGNADKNCGVNNLTPNYIIIQHSDGSRALYLHMKKNSLTSKTVGQTVVAGEFLGNVGSSGSSSGPHLHFEVWQGSTVSTLNDPYSGTCNSLNANSWWATQNAYREPAIIKASLHTAVPVLPACPATETPYEDSCFQPGATAVLAIFMRNETNALVATCKILNPNGSTFSSWTHTSPGDFSGTWWYWNKTLPSTPGTYTFQTTYNGITCSKTFKINCSLVTGTGNSESMQVHLYPNPSENDFSINGESIPNGSYRINLKNSLGEIVLSDIIKIENNVVSKNFSIADLPNGIYLFTMEGEQGNFSEKIVKR